MNVVASLAAVIAVFGPLAVESSAAERPVFESLGDIPDEHGFGGPIGGSHADTLILVGGANFPKGPPWEENGRPPGAKVWHDRTFFMRPGTEKLVEGPRLPYPLAYAPAISTDEGVYVLGGETWSERTGNTDTADVLRVSYDESRGTLAIERNALPPLPRPCSYHAAGLVGRTVFVAVSHRKTPESRTLDRAAFWSLDLSVEPERRRWIERPTWPGPARHKMAVAVARGPRGTKGERLYLISGSTWAEDDDGQVDLARFRYFDDAFAFDPTANEWTRLTRLPRIPESRTIDTSGYEYDARARAWVSAEGQARAVDLGHLFDDTPRAAAAATAVGDGDRVLVLSGSTGRYVTMAVRDRPAFPREVLAYHIDADRWSVAARMPVAVVTSTLFRWNGRFVLASGEVRPGVRTRRLWSIRTNGE